MRRLVRLFGGWAWLEGASKHPYDRIVLACPLARGGPCKQCQRGWKGPE